AMESAEYTTSAALRSCRTEVELPLRSFPSEAEAAMKLKAARSAYDRLSSLDGASPRVRTAECDVFGAEETLTLARASVEGRLDEYASTCMPAEVQCIEIGPWTYIAFPGELFVEYALTIEAEFPG